MRIIDKGFIVLDTQTGKTDGAYCYLTSIPTKQCYKDKGWTPVIIEFKDIRVAFPFVQDPVYHNSIKTKGKKKMRKAALHFIRSLLEHEAATEIMRW